ncbi:MAG TPA: carboxylesterase/lipase family protein [Stellaceae bacterium]|jgi:para-nitrobenzyl esterase|nr:carboxylesterase/lipase family protein [Stellaceae bacterium]
MANDVLSATQSPVVEIATGKIRGSVVGGIHAFKGIPYGASTAGANRFRPPQPVATWSGVRDALGYHAKAPQSPAQVKRRAEMDNILGPVDGSPESEDCLTLNIWTPGLGAAKRPVMVWLHGGAFAYGSGNRAVTDGANLARRGDVVVVSVNHRLNICGYLHLEDIAGARFTGSGNAGSLDMVAALEWVRDNIAAFGGDAGNVTIFGESGGGGKVSALLVMPAARGLFHRAVIQSGAAVRFTTRERANALTNAVVKQIGGVDKLQDVPLSALLGAIIPASKAAGPRAWPLLDRYDFGPVVDGVVVTQHPAEPSTSPLGDAIPLMIGGTAREASLFLDDDPVWHRALGEDQLRERIAAVAGSEADAALKLYRALLPGASAGDRLIAALTGSNFSVRTWLYAERRAAQGGAPVYHYSLDWPSPFAGGRMGAHHAMDLPFVFDTTDVPLSTKGADGAPELAAATSATWAAFARTGKPDNPAIPAWPAYDTGNRATMVFDTRCRVVNDPLREARLLWTKVATKP